MVGGFIIGGSDSTQVIVRALGPSLAPFGIADPLPNPTLEIYDPNGAQIATNDDWRSTQAQEIQATNLPPTNNPRGCDCGDAWARELHRRGA